MRRAAVLPTSAVPGHRRPGPALATLLRRLRHAPPELLRPEVAVPAVLADLAQSLDGTLLDGTTLADLDRRLDGDPDAAALAALTCWLVADRALADHPGARTCIGRAGGAARWLLVSTAALVDALHGLRGPGAWVGEETAREELVRALLAVAGLHPAGEDDAAATDAWAVVSTRYRREVNAQLAQEQRAAEELARRLAEQRAKEAAAQYANY